MDVISNAGAILGRIVFSEDRDGPAAFGCHIEQDRHQMSLGIVLLTVSLASARSIEISEAYVAQPVRFLILSQHAFEGKFGITVRISGVQWKVLHDRASAWLAVDCSRRGEDKAPDTLTYGGVKQRESFGHVRTVVLRRVGDGFAD